MFRWDLDFIKHANGDRTQDLLCKADVQAGVITHYGTTKIRDSDSIFIFGLVSNKGFDISNPIAG